MGIDESAIKKELGKAKFKKEVPEKYEKLKENIKKNISKRIEQYRKERTAERESYYKGRIKMVKKRGGERAKRKFTFFFFLLPI